MKNKNFSFSFDNKPIPLVAFSKNGEYIGEFDNYQDCSFKLNISHSCISNFFIGRLHQAKGYIFIKKENYIKDMIITYDSIVRKRKFLKSKNI